MNLVGQISYLAILTASFIGACVGSKNSSSGFVTPDSGAPASSGSGGTSGTSGGSSGIEGGSTTGSSSGGSSGTSSSTSSGGSSGVTPEAGTEDAGSGCVGVPIVPDANGYVAPGSNSVNIHGSWFEYSDCQDLGGKNCATVTTPPANMFPNTDGSMCTSGITSDATGAWGAGIALEMNDAPPQMPFNMTAAGIAGFCFQLTGSTIPSTTIRVAFPTKNNNDNAYFESVSTPGQHTVLFSDIMQGSWVTTASPWDPTEVMLMQFQIPSSTTAPVPWNFCISGLTAVMQ